MITDKTNRKGKIIVIEGLDGCGKTTQAKLLKTKLEDKGYNVKYIHFPNYDSLSSGPVRMYLNREIKSKAEEINAYMASSFYMVDREITYLRELKEFLEESENNILLCDRYISSNIILQTPKIEDDKEKEEFIRWCYETEVNNFELPLEDICLILTVHPKVSQKLLSKRYNNNEEKKDIHESNLDYLNHCYETIYKSTTYCRNELKLNWKIIDCSTLNNTDIRDIDSIAKSIWVEIEKLI